MASNMPKPPSGYKWQQQFTPEAMDMYRQLFGFLGPDSDLSKMAGGDEGMFQQMEAPAMRQFAGMQGQLASRFSGMGMGGRRSSGFQNTANQQASEFAQGLQSQRMDVKRKALQDLMGYGNMLMGQEPYALTEKKPSFLKSLMSGGLWNMGGEGGMDMGDLAKMAQLAMMFV